MEPLAPIHPESLLEHGPRLRALARRLVHDDHAADDLVQETWVRAVERGPTGGATPWQWLARVLRNLAFQDHRLDARRRERERSVARPESGADERERFAAHHELVAAIEGLDEPYRQAILLRYFDGLPPRRIAARLGVPVKTVKTRLNRGLALLREALDRRHGSRERWMAAMLPLARMGRIWPGLAAPTVTAGGALKLAAATAVVAAGLYWTWPAEEREPVPARELALQTENASAVPARLEPPREARTSARTPAPAETKVTPAAAASSGGGSRANSTAALRARVLDANGVGLPGVLVGFMQGSQASLQSGSDGWVELPNPSLSGWLVCKDERFATVLAADIDAVHPASEYFVVVAPAVTLAGVVHSDGAEFPAPNAQVQIEVPLSFRGRFPFVLDDSPSMYWSTRTDEQGRFELVGAPEVPGARLEAYDEFGKGSVPIPAGGSTAIVIPFEENVWSSVIVGDTVQQRGEVCHRDGTPAPWTLVAADGLITRSNEEALFELAVPRSSSTGTELVAAARGEQAASYRPPRDAGGTQLWPPFVTLVLGPPARSIAGTVFGTDGEPLGGARVWIEDITFVGEQAAHGFVTLEQQTAGAKDGWLRTEAGSDGRFELDGLLERGYTLVAVDPATLQGVCIGPIDAGTQDARIEFSADGLWERVVGRVVDRLGTPLGGLSVACSRPSRQIRSPKGDQWGGSEWLPGVVRTDDQGRFELSRVPREGVTLSLREFPSLKRPLDPSEDPLAIVIEVPRLAHLQIELVPSDPPASGSLAILGPDEQPLTFYVYGGGSVSYRTHVDLANPDEFSGGRTPAMSVPDTATAVVLRDEHGDEVRRVAIALGEDLTVVRL